MESALPTNKFMAEGRTITFNFQLSIFNLIVKTS